MTHEPEYKKWLICLRKGDQADQLYPLDDHLVKGKVVIPDSLISYALLRARYQMGEVWLYTTEKPYSLTQMHQLWQQSDKEWVSLVKNKGTRVY